MSKKELIREKTQEILNIINVKKVPTSIVEEFERILPAYKYVVQNICKQEGFVEGKAANREEAFMNALCVGLTNNPGLPTTNAVLFKHLLDEMDVENYLVASKSKITNQNHVSNLVKIGTEFYYFDCTLEREIYEEEYGSSGNFLMLCAALGKEEYEKFYKPVKLLVDLSKEATEEFPTNIADESISKSVICGISRNIPDFRKKPDIIHEITENEIEKN